MYLLCRIFDGLNVGNKGYVQVKHRHQPTAICKFNIDKKKQLCGVQ